MTVVDCWCRLSFVGVSCRLSCEDCWWRLLLVGVDCRSLVLVADCRVKTVGDGC